MREIIKLENNLLREHSIEVVQFDDDLMALIAQMKFLLEQARGLGIAAVQVGELKRVFLTNLSKDKVRVYINPVIIQTAMEEDFYEEGCLSIPGINYSVKRPYAITIQAFNEKGRPFKVTADKLLARVIQHENDHLNGKLFIDHLDQETRVHLIDSYMGKRKIQD